ncbi:MAG: type IX secretion system sortase PorU [Sphingobacteriaceae bacterium]|nr:type IX secretion system sortase PorU [Sphingobacteriaceae bacterium]
MRFSLFICLFLPNLFLFAQNAEIAGVFSIEKSKTPISNIVKLNASNFEKVVVKNALYDHKKNNLPYFLKSKTNSINTKAIGKLTIVSELKLNAEAANIIKVNFGKYLSSEFQVSSSHGISVNETISSCQIIPFKINELGEVIELIDYSISWDLVASANKTSNANTFKSNSVLASGKWYKLAITRDGVYKLDFLFLNSLGINMSTLDPKNIRIYGNGGVILAEQNEDFRYDDLEENAIVVAGESDNAFNTTDHVLFYGKGMTRWDKKPEYKGLLFAPYNNFYSDTTFYYLNIDIGAGKRIASQNSVATPTNVSTSTYDYYNCHEVDQINFVKSGRNMYGEYFDVNTSYSFVFGDNNFVTGDTIRVESTVAGRGTIANHYNVSVNGLSYNHSIIGFDISNYLADFVVLDTKFGKALNNNATSITASVSRLTPNTVGWIDKVAINARRELVFNGSTFQFRDKRISAPGNVCNYNVNSNAISGTTIWNITDIINPYQQNYTTSGSILSFNANADSLNEYVVFSSSNVLQPTYIGTVQNQNLHALTQADYVIISPTQFLPYANRLAALHQQEEGLTYAVATPEQIYNEFSSGKIDASAIRDFTRMLYTRGMAIGKPTKYLLLFGRGSYLNKNGRAGNTNFIPTYETENSVSYIYSVASDDFYGLMDPQEGYVAENDQADAMDVGVGRIIISNAVQADNVVKKIENYYRKTGITATAPDNCSITQNNQIFGDWRNHIMFCADDADGALHMSQADNLAGKVKAASPAYNIDKVYIDAYKGLSTPGGKRYPDMQAAFNNRVEKGCLIMNYTGHGGEVGLSAERVVDIASIDAWSNFNTLPLFITATCEFSRYDDPDRVSAGELCLLNPKEVR